MLINGIAHAIGRPGSQPEDRSLIKFQIHQEGNRFFLVDISSSGGGEGQADNRIYLDELCDLIREQGDSFGVYDLDDAIPDANNNLRAFVRAVLIDIGFIEPIGDDRYRFRKGIRKKPL